MMKLASMLSTLTLTGSLLCVTALAQTRVCLGGDLEHLTKAQKDSCSAKAQTLRKIAASLHAPDDWHFVVVCGDQGWQQYAAYTMRQDANFLNANVDTNYTERETFLRESALGADVSLPAQSIMTKEIAGILSHTSSQANSGL